MPHRLLRLFIVSIDGKYVTYDMYDSFLVAAKTPEQAVELANAAAGSDPYFAQYNPTAEEVGVSCSKGAKVLMSSFNAG